MVILWTCLKLENAAKFRAVEQHVGTYDEFKAIVDGCHLKPLDRKEEIDSILKPNEHKWNNVAPPSEDNEKTQTKSSNEVDPNNLNQNLNLEKIKIYGDFERLWTSFQFFYSVGPQTLRFHSRQICEIFENLC